MKQSQAFLLTLRDNPRDAEIVSHQLFARSSLIRKHAAGIYSYLPFLVRSFHKLTAIMREEFEKINWQEVIMPFVVPAELWQESGRWQAYGKELLRLKDRKDNDFCLGPTHEEVVTDLVRSQVTSYKQLPLTLYQITTKFRDEIRPRFGLMRGREFEMMDGYSFHPSTADLDKHYEEVAKAYARIFERAGLRFSMVEADTGAIGGSGSHEFHVLAQSGEDAILVCEKCGYAANLEKAETPSPEKQKSRDWGKPASEKPTEVATPTQKTIEEVSAFLQVPPHRNLKTLVYRFNTVQDPKKWEPVVVFVLGHRQLHEVKLKAALSGSGRAVLDVGALPEAEVEKLFGAPVGFLGPIKAPSVLTIFDREIKGAHDLVAGANKQGFHLKHVEPSRDLPTNAQWEDLVSPTAGEPCPRCEGGVYAEYRGIEVGHIFKLRDKYSKAMNAVFQDENKQQKVMEMGCYGIGVTRVLQASVEQNHDADGMIWPEALAPFQVHLLNLAPQDPELGKVGEELYQEFRRRGIEILYDDRDASPGVKFKDADLLGLPRRLVVGKKDWDQGRAEWSRRKEHRAKKQIAVDKAAPLTKLVDDFLEQSR